MTIRSELSDELDVREYTPGRTVTLSCHGNSGFTIEFSPGRYRGFTDTHLSGQLSEVLGRLMASREAERSAALARVVGGELVDPSQEDPATRTFLKAEAGLVAQGGCEDNAVTVRTKGKTQWKVDIAAGSLARLSEDEFTSRFTTAVLAALRDFTLQRAAAKRDILGVDFMHMAEAAKAAIEGKGGQRGDR